ncbi:importin-4-like [Apteryx mantelli]|uniref:Importin-4-like n=1 Tax=Apteryx mantelli TaxID=2696672 RepID=A0ABM4G1H9_9AVES
MGSPLPRRRRRRRKCGSWRGRRWWPWLRPWGGTWPPPRRAAAPPARPPGAPVQRGRALVGGGHAGRVGGALGGAVAPFLPRLGSALGAAAAGDPHPEVRSNALYALGVLAAAAGPALGPLRPAVRGLLGAALGREGPGRVRDNASGALARLGPALTPPEVLPLLLPALPLTEDFEEDSTVFGYLVAVHRSHPEELAEHASALVRVCGSVVGTSRLSPGNIWGDRVAWGYLKV